MAQLSLYVNDAVMDSLRVHSEKEGISISKYVAKIVESFEHGQSDGWPVGYWEKVYGCIPEKEEGKMLTAIDDSSEDCALDPSLDDACDWWMH